MMDDLIYKDFLGTWSLDTATCEYEQGDPPWSDTHQIELDGDELVFIMDWTDAEGETHHASFRAKADGNKMPFNGGPLADALQITATSETELCLSAFRDGLELMTATRTLSNDNESLQLVQTVHLPDLTTSTNRGIYVREA